MSDKSKPSTQEPEEKETKKTQTQEGKEKPKDSKEDKGNKGVDDLRIELEAIKKTQSVTDQKRIEKEKEVEALTAKLERYEGAFKSITGQDADSDEEVDPVETLTQEVQAIKDNLELAEAKQITNEVIDSLKDEETDEPLDDVTRQALKKMVNVKKASKEEITSQIQKGLEIIAPLRQKAKTVTERASRKQKGSITFDAAEILQEMGQI